MEGRMNSVLRRELYLVGDRVDLFGDGEGPTYLELPAGQEHTDVSC